MSDNPHEVGKTAGSKPRTRPTRWMIKTGSILLGVAAICYLATVVMMMLSFYELADSTSTPEPNQLAGGIGRSMTLGFFVTPLGLIGILLLIAGFVLRQPDSNATDPVK